MVEQIVRHSCGWGLKNLVVLFQADRPALEETDQTAVTSMALRYARYLNNPEMDTVGDAGQ
jgi:hypothetical protein